MFTIKTFSLTIQSSLVPSYLMFVWIVNSLHWFKQTLDNLWSISGSKNKGAIMLYKHFQRTLNKMTSKPHWPYWTRWPIKTNPTPVLLLAVSQPPVTMLMLQPSAVRGAQGFIRMSETRRGKTNSDHRNNVNLQVRRFVQMGNGSSCCDLFWKQTHADGLKLDEIFYPPPPPIFVHELQIKKGMF